MVFSEPGFLLFFFPLFFTFYYLAPPALKNVVLLLGSLMFYSFGEEAYLWLLLTSVGLNYAASFAAVSRLGLAAGVAANLGLLGYYKYFNFAFGLFGAETEPVALPIGISFFTFQAVSYLIDVHRKEVEAVKNPIELGLYITMFPQLIAGPIVRFSEVRKEIQSRIPEFDAGFRRFIVGLSKKVLLADPLALAADKIFALPPEALSPETAWLGALCYSFQIYYDFSGYSDMAIGMGRMMGFSFPENFNYPYISSSITEFWRRWHMTLSRWFKDYLYIPLGGNRKGRARTLFNLLVVFILTGLWHGAALTFLYWGLFHGLFLILERVGILKPLPVPVRHFYTLVVLVVSWVLFRADSIEQTLSFLDCMFAFTRGEISVLYPAERFFGVYEWLVFASAFILSSPVIKRPPTLILLYILFAACLLQIYSSAYSPFIYFRF